MYFFYIFNMVLNLLKTCQNQYFTDENLYRVHVLRIYGVDGEGSQEYHNVAY